MGSRQKEGASHRIAFVAKVSGLSVRALHHYDEIGLLAPSGRSSAGYRLYTEADLERLQQVLFFRELGFPLEAIKAALADPAFDRKKALVAQRARLLEEAERARALVRLIDRTLDRMERGETMNPETMFEGFDPSQYEEEAKQRWGGTAAYAESARRTSRYTKEDWATIRAEAEAIEGNFVAAMAAGIPADDTRAMDVAERHREHIARWFYPCSKAMHVGLGEMYVADPRFAENYERKRAGLAAYVRDAIRANAARGGAGEP